VAIGIVAVRVDGHLALGPLFATVAHVGELLLFKGILVVLVEVGLVGHVVFVLVWRLFTFFEDSVALRSLFKTLARAFLATELLSFVLQNIKVVKQTFQKKGLYEK